MASAGAAGPGPIGSGMIPCVRTVFSASVIRPNVAAARTPAAPRSEDGTCPNAGAEAARTAVTTNAAQGADSRRAGMRFDLLNRTVTLAGHAGQRKGVGGSEPGGDPGVDLPAERIGQRR